MWCYQVPNDPVIPAEFFQRFELFTDTDHLIRSVNLGQETGMPVRKDAEDIPDILEEITDFNENYRAIGAVRLMHDVLQKEVALRSGRATRRDEVGRELSEGLLFGCQRADERTR